ncbi:MAG TPA: MarC family protein [Cyclobacteriaceae bacterium]
MEVFLGTLSALFSVVNPIGATPVFISLTQENSKKEIKDIALRTAIYMVLILVIFFLAGKFILDFFGILVEHIRIAGGIMIVISGMRLLRQDSEKGKIISKEVRLEGMEKDDISFTPMAMPLLSGPGSIALLIGMFDSLKGPAYWESGFIILAIILVSALTFIILLFSRTLNKFLGKGGMAALSRLMGFIVLSIGIGMIMNGLIPLLKQINVN